MQNSRRKAPDNNNSVKFTSSKGDNSTTNDSMVMKIAHAQLHMYTNIMYRRKGPDKTVSTDRQTDGQTAMAIPLHFVVVGAIMLPNSLMVLT